MILAISSSSQVSAKTTLTARPFERDKELLEQPADEIMYCYGKWQETLVNSLKKAVKNINFHEGLPATFEFGKGHTLYVHLYVSSLSLSIFLCVTVTLLTLSILGPLLLSLY
jgi:hypothetical protein